MYKQTELLAYRANDIILCLLLELNYTVFAHKITQVATLPTES